MRWGRSVACLQSEHVETHFKVVALEVIFKEIPSGAGLDFNQISDSSSEFIKEIMYRYM